MIIAIIIIRPVYKASFPEIKLIGRFEPWALMKRLEHFRKYLNINHLKITWVQH